jgi:hypothetical protein
MKRGLIAIIVLALAVATSSCRQLVAHRPRAFTVSPTGPYFDTQGGVVSGNAADWADTWVTSISECVGAPTNYADFAADCGSGGYNALDMQAPTTGEFAVNYAFLRYIETQRSGLIDCAVTACSLVVVAYGPYYCDDVHPDRPGCWRNPQPGDDFEVFKSMPITFLRTPEAKSDCVQYRELVDTHGQSFASRAKCEQYVATLDAVHATPATGLRDGQKVRVTASNMRTQTWDVDPELTECVGTPHNAPGPPQDCTNPISLFDIFDGGAFSIDFTVTRHIQTPHGLVDCAATTCTIALFAGDGTFTRYDPVVSTPITFASS